MFILKYRSTPKADYFSPSCYEEVSTKTGEVRVPQDGFVMGHESDSKSTDIMISALCALMDIDSGNCGK